MSDMHDELAAIFGGNSASREANPPETPEPDPFVRRFSPAVNDTPTDAYLKILDYACYMYDVDMFTGRWSHIATVFERLGLTEIASDPDVLEVLHALRDV